jgi:hypothetical protein
MALLSTPNHEVSKGNILHQGRCEITNHRMDMTLPAPVVWRYGSAIAKCASCMKVLPGMKNGEDSLIANNYQALLSMQLFRVEHNSRGLGTSS